MDAPCVTQDLPMHLLSAVLALIFLTTRRIQPFLFPVDREVEFCVLRPFLTRKLFQEILGLEGSKIAWGKKTFLTRKFSGKISSPKISSGNFGSNSPSRGNFEAQNFLRDKRNFYEEIFGSLDNRTEISTLSQYWMMPTFFFLFL